MQTIPVLLSGGIGTRLWPSSRVSRPKQFLELFGRGTLLQMAARRLDGVPGVGDPIVVCSDAHVDSISEQLAEIGVRASAIVTEPTGRNTAPAVAAAALVAPPEAILVVLPADHVIRNVGKFRDAVEEAVSAASDGDLVLFGVVPHRPETGYGYIRWGRGDPARIEEFVEKPDHATAVEYLAGGSHLWNSGMFVFRAGAVIEEFRNHAPDVLDAVVASLGESPREGIIHLSESFLTAPSISIDHAIMEKTKRAVVVSLEAGWSDVGSWQSLWEIESRDGDDNALIGDVLAVDTRSSYVRSDGRLIAVLGVNDLIVVDTGDVVLVVPRNRAQEVKSLVEMLQGRPELL